MKVTLTIPESAVQKLSDAMEKTDCKTYSELMSNALTMLFWSISQLEESRMIVSVDEDWSNVRELQIPFFSRFKNDHELAAVSMQDIGEVLTLVASSGIVAGAYNLLKSWIDAKNGRKLRLKVGDIEVEATQMAGKDVLRLLKLLQENAEQKKIRDLLLEASPARSEDRPSHKG